MIEVVAILIVLAIVAAIIVVKTTNLLFSVISVGAVGFLLAIIFLLLGAPDVAIVQIGVEVISLVILVRATIGRDVEPALGHRGLIGMIMAVTLVVAIGLFGLQIFADFPAFGSSVMERFAQTPSDIYLREGLASTGIPNTVTAVLLDYRAYDTLGEVTVLFCAVVGVLTILRRKARAHPTGDEAEADRK
jgi:multisubunit Na+/H+ antiporter MnhB subunit